MTLRARLAVVAAIAFMSALQPAAAQTSTGTPGASAAAAAAFLANPGQVLQQNPTGGQQLVSRIRDLAVADPATLQSILQLLATANKDQKVAIGAGLAQAAKIVVRTNQAYATQIQQAILDTKDQDVVLAYAAAAGDTATGAAGGAGAAGGGAVGGQTNSISTGGTGGGTAQSIGGGGVQTGSFSMTSSVGGTGSSLSTSP